MATGSIGGAVPAWRRALAACLAGGVGLAAATATLPARALAQPATGQAAGAAAGEAAGAGLLDQGRLEQLLAPVALYPDSLLMQVLMAATYPLEVVQAQRWLGQGTNATLRGEALASALAAQSWDPSVKSLVPFPDVLSMMNDQLEWTQELGDALLAQQQDVLNAVQVLRGRAQAAGTLQTTPQQTVQVTQNVTVAAPAAPPGATDRPPPAVAPPPQIIVIEPAQPQQVYVPVYNPTVVYGAWPYPSYPPPYYPPPPGYAFGSALLTGLAFGTGVAIAGSLWGWASPGWGRGDVDINVNRYNNINVNRAQISSNTWRHDTTHRHGVAYPNDRVRAEQRGAAAPSRADSRDQFRGRAEQAQRDGAADRARAASGPAAADRREAPRQGTDRPQPQRPAAERPPAQRPAAERPAAERPGTTDRQPAARPQPTHTGTGRPATAPQRPAAQPASRDAALQDVGRGGDARAASERGQASRQAAQAPRAPSRPSGGGRESGGRGR
jgi:hypothetical protein